MHRRKAAFLSAVSREDIGQVRRLVLEQYHHLECAHLSWTGLQPLQLACEKRYNDLALFLVENGAPISTEAFYWAYENRLSIVVVEMMTRSPQTGLLALLHACESKQVELAKVLIGAGASVNIADKRGRLPLLAACENGNPEIVKLLMNAEADVKRTGEFGRSPLLAACENDVEIVKLLIDAGADVNEADEFGRFPLLAACEKSDIEIVKLLILAGAEVQKTDENGRFSLLAACECEKSDVEIVDLLIDAGAEVNRADKYERFSLLAACRKNDVETAKLLINAGADVRRTDKFGTFPLLAACENSAIECVKLLIGAGVDINKADQKLLWRFPLLLAACQKSDVHFVKTLIEAGVDVNKVANDLFKKVPLLAACEKGEVGIVQILIDAGADLNKTDVYGMFPLLAACEKGDVKIVKILINAGGNCNEADVYGIFPLLTACEKGNEEIAQRLINAGADVNKQVVYGILPWLVENEFGDVKNTKRLIDAGADANKADKIGKSPLLAACEIGDVKIAKSLIEAGADVNKADVSGKVSLSTACGRGDVEIAKLLIGAGADVNKADKLEKAPLLVACEKGDVEIAKLLIGAGADINKADKFKKTPILTVCKTFDAEIAKLLISAGAEVDKHLFAACEEGNDEIVKLLIGAGADVNKTDKFKSAPLLAACKQCKVYRYTVKLLIDAGGDVNKADKFGNVPLLAACEKGDVDIARLLIIAGADVHKADKYLLVAYLKGNVKLVKLLIDAGGDVNKADEFGNVPLLAACEEGDVEIANLLINAGADVHKADKYLLVAYLKGNFKLSKLLIDAGGDVNKADEFKNVPLLVACKKGDIEFTTMLINAGADVNKTDKKGRTALYIACSSGNYSIGVFLLKSCPNLADSGKSSLKFILQRHQFSTEISTVAVNLVKTIVTRSPFLTTLRNEDDYLYHDLPCPVELKRILVGFWIQYQYRELYAQGTTKPNAVKVCVIGEARAGKTTLIKSLRNVHWTEGGDDRRTASVDVTTANIESVGKLVFCDFAGQPFFHKTHGLFFSTSSTIFLLVVDVTLDDEELRKSSHYWASFVKCSVPLSGKAHVLVIGSRKDLLSQSSLKTAITNLQSLLAYLQSTFGRWFNFSKNAFILNCRQRRSFEMSLFLQTLREVKILALQAADEVPRIVETAKETLLPLLRNVGCTKASLFQKFTSSLLSVVSNSHGLAQDVRQNVISVLKNYGFISDSNKMKKPACVRFIKADVFKKIMLESVCAGFSEQVQSLLVEFLQAIGEILVIGDTVILDPPWLCQNVVGPLLSPKIFPIHLDSSLSGTASKENIQSVLEIFNKRKWDDVDHTISLLRRLEICYPVLEQTETYQFPALIEEHRPPHAWRKNPDMTVYVGRRLMSEEITDIITPGTMPFIQSSARNASCFRPSEPIVWQGGLLIKRTIGSHFVEGMIVFQNREKAMDFIVRGPEHSEKQCMKHLRDLMDVGMEVLLVKSPGTTRTLWYISRTELEALKDFPLAHKSQTVEETIKMSKYLNAKVCQKGIEDTLKDLLALPDDHFTFVPYEARCTICECLDKDTKERSALAKRLPGFSTVDRYLCKTSEQLLIRWGENLKATTKIFADCARASGLLYLLMILYDCGSLELSADEKKAAKADLDFVEASTPSVPATRQLTRLASGKRADSATDALDSISTSADSAAASQQQDEATTLIRRFLR
ncbi:uncharacterized protein [Oscarella lobularis]|uniref:uncharacterized protein isoform X3 n=1 Tax=Oscarella lobularis TaxID=121494 RepID=UPI003314083E